MRVRSLAWVILGLFFSGVLLAVLFVTQSASSAPELPTDIAMEPEREEASPLSTEAQSVRGRELGDASSHYSTKGLADEEIRAVESFRARYPGAFDASTEEQYLWLLERGFPTTEQVLAFRRAHPRFEPGQAMEGGADPLRQMLLADLAIEEAMARQAAGDGMDGEDGASPGFTIAFSDATTSLAFASRGRSTVFLAYQHAQLEALMGEPERRALYLGVAESCGDTRLRERRRALDRAAISIPLGVQQLFANGGSVPGCRDIGLEPFPLDTPS